MDSIGTPFCCAYDEDKTVGFLYLKQTGKDNVEPAVMGVNLWEEANPCQIYHEC